MEAGGCSQEEVVASAKVDAGRSLQGSQQESEGSSPRPSALSVVASALSDARVDYNQRQRCDRGALGWTNVAQRALLPGKIDDPLPVAALSLICRVCAMH